LHTSVEALEVEVLLTIQETSCRLCGAYGGDFIVGEQPHHVFAESVFGSQVIVHVRLQAVVCVSGMSAHSRGVSRQARGAGCVQNYTCMADHFGGTAREGEELSGFLNAG
jgi:hypothetical protein